MNAPANHRVAELSPGACRILHLLPTLERRGAQMFAHDLISGMAMRGDSQQRVAILDPGQDEVGITRLGVTVHWLSARFGAGKLMQLRTLQGQWKPDIVLAYGGRPLKHAVLARLGARAPRIVYRKIGLTERWLGRGRLIKLPFQRWLARQADAISAVGVGMQEELITLFRADPRKVRVIYRGVDASRFEMADSTRVEMRASIGFSSDAPLLIAVGALSWEKNLPVMLRALATLRNAHPTATLLLVGEGAERAKLETLAQETGVAAAVRFLGQRDDVPQLMAAADLLLLTSLTEGVPGVLIEAGLARLPCVAWDVGGVREVLRDNGPTDRVTPFGDEDALHAAILAALDARNGAEEALTARRQFCLDRFSSVACCAQHVTLFAEVFRQSGVTEN